VTILLARLKQSARWLWAAAGLLAAGCAWVLVGWWLSRRRPELAAADPVDLALQRYDRTTAVANARAAVEIAVHREKDRAVRAELMEALALGDEDEEIARLIAVGKKVRGER
jgi:hypothetical protein